jgi:uncharacterized membrane protein
MLFISCSIISCTQNGNPVQTKSPAPVLKLDTLRITKEFTGIYYNDGNAKFISCENPKIIYSVKNSQELDQSIIKILPNAYKGEAIIVTIMAEISSSDDKAYGGLLDVKELKRSEQKSSKNTCIPYDFWCLGNEPFWQLQISGNENLIDYYNPMEQKTMHFNYSEPVEKDGFITYNAVDKSNASNKILIVIKKEKCSDGMSEKQYNYSAEVTLNDKQKGCAIKFGEN